MADLSLDSNPVLCELCEASPARSGDEYCDGCTIGVMSVFLRAVGAAARRLAPEAWALLVILFFMPTFGYWVLLLLFPTLCVVVPHIVANYRQIIRWEIDEFLHRSLPVWEAQQYLSGFQQGKAQVRAELRREVVALGIPISVELEEMLWGERRRDELPYSDRYAIQPALEALAKRHQQREEAYGIDAGLPHGGDPVC